MAAIREERSREFQKVFSGYTDEDKDVILSFLVEIHRNGNQHMSGADFTCTLQQLNYLLTLLMTLCPSMRPRSVGIRPGDTVQMYSHGDLIIPDFF
jgi:hypothetical protein